jgi:hypothetical protein
MAYLSSAQLSWGLRRIDGWMDGIVGRGEERRGEDMYPI